MTTPWICVLDRVLDKEACMGTAISKLPNITLKPEKPVISNYEGVKTIINLMVNRGLTSKIEYEACMKELLINLNIEKADIVESMSSQLVNGSI